MKSFLSTLAINIIILLSLVFISYVIGFLIGLGSSDYSKYQIYITSLLIGIQLVFLLYLFFKNQIDSDYMVKRFKFVFVAIIIILLSLVGSPIMNKLMKFIF